VTFLAVEVSQFLDRLGISHALIGAGRSESACFSVPFDLVAAATANRMPSMSRDAPE